MRRRRLTRIIAFHLIATLAAIAVAAGFVASLSRPGGNITGTTNFAPETSGKLLELLIELVPALNSVAVLRNPRNPASVFQFREIEVASRALNRKIVLIDISTDAELDDAFARMKPSAYLVNCSRGPVVDTAALVRALDSKKIAGCALDTTDPEPLPDPHPLRGRENVTITPHAAWYSEQAMSGLQAGAPGEVRRVLSGEWPVHAVNPSVRGRNRAGL